MQKQVAGDMVREAQVRRFHGELRDSIITAFVTDPLMLRRMEQAAEELDALRIRESLAKIPREKGKPAPRDERKPEQVQIDRDCRLGELVAERAHNIAYGITLAVFREEDLQRQRRAAEEASGETGEGVDDPVETTAATSEPAP